MNKNKGKTELLELLINKTSPRNSRGGFYCEMLNQVQHDVIEPYSFTIFLVANGLPSITKV
jgi:hypothetical protein